MVQRKIATYISDSGVSTELRTELQHIFDTYQVFPEVPAQVGYISLVPDSTWALGLGTMDIWNRHRSEVAVHNVYCYKPIIIFDAQTVRDETVLMVADFQNEKEEFVVATLRIAPPMVSLAAMNIEIVNQTIDEVRVQQCSVNRDTLKVLFFESI